MGLLEIIGEPIGGVDGCWFCVCDDKTFAKNLLIN
jgi:hypothetical protein